MAWLCVFPCTLYQGMSRGPSMGQGPTHLGSGTERPGCDMGPGTWVLPMAPRAAQPAPCPSPEGMLADSPLRGQKTAPSAGSLSKTSNSHIVAWGRPPYLLSPILYEVDRYSLKVDAFQGQSYEKQQSQGTASGSTSKGYMTLLREASFPTLLGDQGPARPCPRLSSFPGHQPFPHLRSLPLRLSHP